jgi:mycothiol system anti-sigma-R factor
VSSTEPTVGAAARPAGAPDRCQEVLERAFEYLDGEMPELDCEAVREHLAECLSCVEQLREDEKLKRVIREGCPCEEAPERLRARIILRITEVRTSTA